MSSDGAWIYFQSRSSPSAPWELWRQPTSGGPKEFVVSSEYNVLLRPIAATDGRIYYYEPGPAEVREGGRIWSLSANEDAAPVLRMPLGTNFSQWTVWQHALAYLHHQDSVTFVDVYDPRSGSTTRIATLPKFAPLPTFPGADVLFQLHPGLAISPDGRWILYVTGTASADLVLWRDPW
jgi:Tol biopolymer transport system component